MYNRSFSTHAIVWRHSGGNITEKRCKKYFLLMWIRSVWPMVMKPSRRKARKIVVAFQKASPKKWADCGLGNFGNPLHSGNTDASINFREAVLKEREGNRVDIIKILLEKQSNFPSQTIAYIFIVLRYDCAMLSTRQGWNYTLSVPKEILRKSLFLSEKWVKINYYLFFSNTSGSMKAVLCQWMTEERQTNIISHEDNIKTIPG